MEYVYTVLILHEKEKEITEDSIRKVMQSIGIVPDPNQIEVLLNAIEGLNIGEILQQSIIVSPEAIVQPEVEVIQEEKNIQQEEEPEEELGLTKLFG